MKIAYVCADFGVAIFGRKGASVHVREMVAALAEIGHEVRVFAPELHEPGSGDGGWPEGIVGRVGLARVPLEREQVAWLEELRRAEELLGQRTRLRQELRNLLYNLTLQTRLVHELAEDPPDFVYERYALFGLAGIAAARTLGVPHLLEVNAPLAEEQERMRGLEMKELARSAERRILRSTGATIVVSRRLAEWVIGRGVPESSVHVVSNAVDPRRFDPGTAAVGPPDEVRERLSGQCVVGFVGSLKPWHGVETLLEAFLVLAARLPDIHLLVVGDGPARADLERVVRERGAERRVTFVGAVAHGQVPGWLSLVDIASAPYTPHENFYFSPIKLFEYMAMAIPVVAGRIGQVAELLADGVNGLLHEPGDAGALAAALERLVRDRALRESLGREGRRAVGEEHTWRGNAARIVAIAAALGAGREPARAAGGHSA